MRASRRDLGDVYSVGYLCVLVKYLAPACPGFLKVGICRSVFPLNMNRGSVPAIENSKTFIRLV